MKDKITNANFPRDEEQRVYHMSVKLGDVANRILTVGDHVRARKIARFLDSEEETGHPVFEKTSQRGFLTITGRYKGVPVSIIAIGMGNCMMDFFVREVRASVEGTLAIIRFGSCGSLSPDAPPGTIIVPKSGYCIRRNIDYFAEDRMHPELDQPYIFSGTFPADKTMTAILSGKLEELKKENEDFGPVLTNGDNADGCSFYSSQGREDPDFLDDNEELLKEIMLRHPETQSIEMESSMLFHLALCARNPKRLIKAAACMQVFADRLSNRFISSETVAFLEPIVGKACLEALIEVKVENEMSVKGTVWEPVYERKAKD